MCGAAAALWRLLPHRLSSPAGRQRYPERAGVATVSGIAAVAAFRGGVKIERYLWHARRILAELGKKNAALLNKAGIRVCPPEGAFYLFLDFTPQSKNLKKRGIKTGRELCQKLLEETGVAVLPGSAFGRPDEELTARFAYVDFDGAKALTASETIPLEKSLPDDFIDHWCGNVIKATRAIIDWVKP